MSAIIEFCQSFKTDKAYKLSPFVKQSTDQFMPYSKYNFLPLFCCS